MNYQFNPYQMYQPYQQQLQQLQQLQQQIPQIQQQMSQPQQASLSPQNGGMFYFVNSRKEVDDWVLNAGQTAFFFERNASVFYIKSVAQNGLSQPIEVYDYTQRNESQEESRNIISTDYVTREEFEEFKNEIESIKEAEG